MLWTADAVETDEVTVVDPEAEEEVSNGGEDDILSQLAYPNGRLL